MLLLAPLGKTVARVYSDTRPNTSADSREPDVPKTIDAGAAVSLMHPSLYAGGFDGTWVVEKEGTVKIRAACVTEVNGVACNLLSEWVEVPVKK